METHCRASAERSDLLLDMLAFQQANEMRMYHCEDDCSAHLVAFGLRRLWLQKQKHQRLFIKDSLNTRAS